MAEAVHPTKSKTETKYRDYPYKNQWCGKCTMYRPQNRCTLVQGRISPRGWCDEFVDKGSLMNIDNDRAH